MSEFTTEPKPVTTDASGVPTTTPQPKVIAATTGAAVGAAASTLIVFGIEELAHVDLPTTVEGAILVLVVATATYLAGYFKRPSASAS